MFRVLRSVLEILREVVLALIWQPSHPGPTRAERAVNAVKQQNLHENLQRPASAWDAARQIGKEIFKAAILRPSAPPRSTEPPRRKK